ncbi:MAG: FAD-dependent oxidoreductase, partial [Pseudomonadota bacterium]
RHTKLWRVSNGFGVSAGEAKISFPKVNAHIRSVIDTIAPMDSQERFESLGVTVLREHARFLDGKTVVAGDTTIKARRFVVATGSSAFVPPIPGLDQVSYETNESLFQRTRNPGSLIVIGGGPIGLEMAQAHHRLGAKVTVVEGQKALGKDDPELAQIVLDRLRDEGVTILEGTKVTSVAPLDRGRVRVNVEMETGADSLDGDTLLVATGRAATVDGLDLEKAGVKYTRRGITVNDKMRSSNRRVYAVGDVAGGLQFTHVAGYQAGLVVRALLFRLPAKQNTGIIPWCTYTDPELAHVGETEASAREKYKDLTILRWPYAENDRSQADRKTDGLIKIMARQNGLIIGVSIAGAMAGEMMNMWALAVSQKLKVRDIAGYVPPYPTVSEIGKRAATSFYAPVPKKPFIRGVVRFLQKFG